MSTAILGIDIAKLKFDVALLQNQKYKSKVFKNNNGGFEELSVWLNEEGVQNLHACLEATGTYGEALSHYLADSGFIVSVVNPAQIKGFAQGELSRTKTDKADAKLIARYCQAMIPPVWRPLPQHTRELKGWVKHLGVLQNMYHEENNRLEVAQPSTEADIKEVIDFLGKKIVTTQPTYGDFLPQPSQGNVRPYVQSLQRLQCHSLDSLQVPHATQCQVSFS